ncbi:MAG: HAD family hydrolase [Muribaculaceae bacterium]
MSKITTIFLDFGRVLVDYDFSRFFDVLRHDYPISEAAFKEFMQVVLAEETYSSLDREVIPFAEQIEALKQKHPLCAELFDAFDSRFQEVVTGEVPGMRQLIAELRRSGLRLYGLSNWSSKVYETMRNYSDIFGLLNGRVLSCEEHLLKPEPAIYERALERFGVAAEECVFVDDKQPNIDGCRAVGIDGILFKGAANLAAELKKRGVRL